MMYSVVSASHRARISVTKSFAKLQPTLLSHFLSTDESDRHRSKSSVGNGVNTISRELQDKISGLDIASAGPSKDSSTRSVPMATRERLGRPLEPVAKVPLSAAQLGALQATAEDLQDVLTDALSTSAFHGLFKGASDPSEVVYIDEIKLNRDCSHATVLWKSDVLRDFVFKSNSELGEYDTKRLIKRSVKYVNGKLQHRESDLRSIIIRKMHFRRVPRLFFAPWDVHLGAKFGDRRTIKGEREIGAPKKDPNDILNPRRSFRSKLKPKMKKPKPEFYN